MCIQKAFIKKEIFCKSIHLLLSCNLFNINIMNIFKKIRFVLVFFLLGLVLFSPITALADDSDDPRDRRYAISGRIINENGAGISGVTVTLDGLGQTQTDSNGYYRYSQIRISWSGNVTPTKSGFIFCPWFKNYSNLRINQNDQNYEGAISNYIGPPPIVDITLNGNTRNYSCSNSNNGVIRGGASPNSENSYSFDGINDYIEINNIGPIKNKTISAWVKFSTKASLNQAAGGLITIQEEGSDVFDSAVYNENVWGSKNTGWLFGSNNWLRTSYWPDYPTDHGSREPSWGNWVHVVAIYSDNKYELYRNGKRFLREDRRLAHAFSNAKMLIGLRHSNPDGSAPSDQNRYLKADIKNVRVYNVALSASEVVALYNARKTSTPLVNSNYRIKSALGNFYLDISGAVAMRKANVFIWDSVPNRIDGTPNFVQQWILEPTTGNKYRIKSALGNFYLDVQWGAGVAKTNVWLWGNQLNPAQEWILEPTTGNKYRIKSTLGNFYLDVVNGVKKANVQIDSLDSTDSSQEWIFE